MKDRKRVVESEHGSAIALVIIVIMIVMLLGLTSLIITTNNVKMASKFRTSNKEYYELETSVEKILKTVDSKLQKAENTSLEYMRLEEYCKSKDDLENKYSYKGDIYKKENQEFFHQRWNEKVYKTSLIKVIDLNKISKEIVDIKKYNQKMATFYTEAFSRLYYNIVIKELEGIESEVRYQNSDILNKGITFKASMEINSSRNFKEVDKNSIWDNYEPKADDVKILINVIDKKGKKLNAQLNITPPTYEALEKKRYSIIRSNDVYSKAINTTGIVNFLQNTNTAEQAKFDKDKFLEYINKDALISNDTKSSDKDKFGIVFLKEIGGNNYTINKDESGIIYSEGDLTIKGNGIFRGAIIVEGNVTVEENAKIIHDEKVIKNILESNDKVIEFFRAGANGKTLIKKENDKEKNVRARKPKFRDRYKIAKWQEE